MTGSAPKRWTLFRKGLLLVKKRGGMGGITTGSGRGIFLFGSQKIPQASNVLKEALKSCFKRKPIQRVFRSFLSSKIHVKKGSRTYFWTTFLHLSLKTLSDMIRVLF